MKVLMILFFILLISCSSSNVIDTPNIINTSTPISTSKDINSYCEVYNFSAINLLISKNDVNNLCLTAYKQSNLIYNNIDECLIKLNKLKITCYRWSK